MMGSSRGMGVRQRSYISNTGPLILYLSDNYMMSSVFMENSSDNRV